MFRKLAAGMGMVFALLTWQCSHDGIINSPSSREPGPKSANGDAALTERSGQNPILLDMGPAPAVSDPGLSSGTWTESTDSLGTKTVFMDTASGGWATGTTVKSGGSIPMYDMAVPGVAVGAAETNPGTGTEAPGIQAGVLTAGEWNDHLNWHDFQGFIHEYPASFTHWRLNLQKRIMIEIKDSTGRVVPGADIQVVASDKIVFAGKTRADGRAAFFPLDAQAEENGQYQVSVRKGATLTNASINPVADDDQTWTLIVPSSEMPARPALDLAFVVDVTGSMSDELSYIQTEMVDICKKVYSAEISGLRVGFVFYRDRGDEFVTRVFEFTDNFENAQANIKWVHASGGGDKEESVNLAMHHMLQKLSWRTDDCVRLCFWITDAGPHYYADETYTYHQGLDEANEKGVIINPVAASGMDRDEEYFYRNAAVKTMGRYIFITDNSGVGEAHLSPDVGAIDAQKLNALIENAITEELAKWPKK